MSRFILELVDEENTSFGFVVFDNTTDSILSPVFGEVDDADGWFKGFNAGLKK